ncbi:MAG TPA: glucose-6-phosphate dehydrogenase assembly protein OpcA [Candidatus Limnocylindria bacterium]|jgi:glucose-6-phosphate dehydrogenase assembly protein OpcA|nr:glucose-6-phosphate dehydrogenase assembly protein OpcA [Candidatus Limnocylindria bacterium]
MAEGVAVDTDFWGVRCRSVAELERELTRLRRAQNAHAREQGRTVARASVLNLIVYADRESHARRAARSIADLALRHPSRAIVVLADRGPREGVEPSIEMYCHLPIADDARQVSYEQILLRARGDVDDRIASAVIPLLVPDLPIFLWWTGTPPLGRRSFGDLLRLVDRLVVDSADFARPEATLPVIARISESARGRFGLTDLNWTRLTPWREIVTAFFDVPAWRGFLDGITGVRVGFAVDMDGRDIHPSQALLLVGWLASRLGWRPLQHLAPSEAGGLLFAIARADGARVMVRVRPRFERGLEGGDVSGIRLQARRDQLAEFVVKRQPDPWHQTAAVLLDGEQRWQRTVPLPSPAIVELIGEELSIIGSDHTYEQALRALVDLA